MLRRMSCVALLTILVVAAGVGRADASYTEYDSLTYAYVGGRPLHVALFIPMSASAANPVPCLVWVHGGGWEGGAYLPVPSFIMPLVTEKGIAIASVQYRLTSQEGYFASQPVIFPAQIQDVKGAVRWLRAHAATYHLDPQHFGSWGNSAGGHLSALLGTSGGVTALEGSVGGNPGQSSRVQVFADYNGPTDILHLSDLVTTPPGCLINFDAPDSPTSHLVGWDLPWQGVGDIKRHEFDHWGAYPGLVALCQSANPITWVDSDDPPCTISHGDQDTTVPLGASRIFNAALTAAGVSHEYHVIPGVGHGDLGEATHEATIDYLAAHLLMQTAVAPGAATGEAEGARLMVSPNPGAGPFRFAVSRVAPGSLVEVADVAGRHVRRLALGADGTARWDGRDARGQRVASGLYFAKLAEGGRADEPAIRLVILR